MTKSFSLFIFFVLIISFASCAMDVLSNPDACVSELPSCELNLAKPIGKKGLPGDKGIKGDMGRPGANGSPGEDGRDGRKGRDGAAGIRGLPGSDGPPGASGWKGEKGNTGGDYGTTKILTGPMGAPGPKGEQGQQGPSGKMGTPGIDPTCGCKVEVSNELDDLPSDSGPEWGITTIPNVTCRNAPASVKFSEGQNYDIYLELSVTCDPESRKTCVMPYANENNYTGLPGLKPFWLSELGVSLMDIYNLEFDQLSWLQSESLSAEMTIKYHCFNSKPLGDESTDPIKLLSWNDVTIGPESTPSSPFHYTVLSDDCSNAKKDDWSSTVIKLDSPIDGRLPIVDFFISDIKNETQSFRIEILNLCFY